MDFDLCDYDDMQDEDMQNTEENTSYSLSGDVGLGNDISFTGHIDDIYNPEINRANNHLVDHTEDLLHAKTDEEIQSALDHIKDDRHTIEYWEDCKHRALIESKKNDIFLDGINAQLEILEKYSK